MEGEDRGGGEGDADANPTRGDDACEDADAAALGQPMHTHGTMQFSDACIRWRCVHVRGQYAQRNAEAIA